MTTDINLATGSDEDAHGVLAGLGLTSEFRWPWVSVGRSSRQQGWKIHISCTPLQLPRLIGYLAEHHRREGFPFKVISSIDSAMLLNEGSLGDTQIGKCATVYPADDEQFIRLVECFRCISDLQGPKVPDDVWLGGVVFARYGGFNPIIKRDTLGQIGRFIEEDGSVILDAYDRKRTLERFHLQFGASRIGSLIQQHSRLPEGIIHGRYLIVDNLRDSGKGGLLQALDVSKKDRVLALIIKQGRAGVLSDRNGHDIRDRLRHQWSMHEIAASESLVPKCHPYFEIDGDGYLPLEFQRNDNLEARIQMLLRGRTIDHCTPAVRGTILSILVSVGELLERLHHLGIVHRDLSPSNVLLDQDDRAVLSDLEIAWRMGSGAPVYGKGTPGFMAPEQNWGAQPDPLVDAHAYSALILYSVTGLDPRRLPTPERSDRWQSLSMLCQSLDPEFWSIVQSGLSQDPRDRRGVGALCHAVKEVASQKAVSREGRRRPVRLDMFNVLQAGTAALASPALLDSASGIWLSAPMQGSASGAKGPELRRSLHRGVAGILYYCAIYQRSLPLENELRQLCQKNARWLIDDRTAVDYGMPGLHFGEAGVLVALYAARREGIIDFGDAEVQHLWNAVLDHPIAWPDITHGASGIALALAELHALGAVIGHGPQDLMPLTLKYLDFLVASQRSDGAWTVPGGVEGLSGETLTGFAHGVAGIAHALAALGPQYADRPYLNSAIRAADWLLSTGVEEHDGGLAWPYSDAHPERWMWWCHGAPGISSTFLTLFRTTGDRRYRTAALRCFVGVPSDFNPANLSLCHGAAGLGELLIDLAHGLDREDLEQRASEIATIICARHARGNRDVYWIVEDTEFVSGDLMVGMCGVLHFILRLCCKGPHQSLPAGIGTAKLTGSEYHRS